MPPRKRIVKVACILVVIGLALWVGLHGGIRAHELQRRLICAANLKGIGTSAKVYATMWERTMPIIDWLVKTAVIDPKSTKCPCADRPNYVVVTAALATGKANRPIDNRMAIAYEPKSNHGDEGGNILFGDGHAEFVRVPAYDELVNSIAKDNP